jgi:hypothetical protein
LDDEIHVDFYVAVPEIMPELNPLKKKLKKRFPRINRSKGEFFLLFQYTINNFLLNFLQLESKVANTYVEKVLCSSI